MTSPVDAVRDLEAAEEAVTTNPDVGRELREAVAEVLHVDPETLRPR